MMMTWHDIRKRTGDNREWNDNDIKWENELVTTGDEVIMKWDNEQLTETKIIMTWH